MIYTSLDTLMHKRGLDGFQRYFWNTSKVPKDFQIGSRIWFATPFYDQETMSIRLGGCVQGYFLCDEYYPGPPALICWDKKSWTPAPDRIEVKPFRGWRYRWWA